MRKIQLLGAALALAVLPEVVSAQAPASPFVRNPWPMAEKGPVKVFILAGQSNMQGHASLRTLEYLIYNKETAPEYQQWKDRVGKWTERRDVWIWTTDGERYGNLKPGFGANETSIGPELGFGWVVGEALPEQVLLIKTCWGGRSVRRDFLPPGSKLPPEEELRKELERARKRKPGLTLEDIRARYGKAYRDMISAVKEVLGNLKKYFSAYNEKRGYEIAGFVFFQGFNDMIDREQRAEKFAGYTKRLGQLILDLRKDLGAPDLPVVIGELGVGGRRGDFQKAQAAVAELPDLKGTVAFVKTCEFWEPEVEKMVKSGMWKGPEWPKFYNVGSQKGYHYLGSARIYWKIGKAMAKGMLELISK